MAGEWIKMGVGLRTHPKVVRMAAMLKADRLRVVGGLHAVWGLFDMHSVDGHLDGYTAEVMDADLGWKGFSAAMVAIGWLEETPEGLSAPDYEEHNGPVAKRRAMETSRKGRSRKVSAESPHDEPPDGGHASASHADNMRNREEKRREEEPPIAPKGASRSGAVGLKAWLDAIKASGERPIPPGDPVLAYADKVGIPRDYLVLAWQQFVHTYTTAREAKRYRDWRKVFRNAVEANWLNLWYLDGQANTYALTTVGHQAQRAHDDRRAA